MTELGIFMLFGAAELLGASLFTGVPEHALMRTATILVGLVLALVAVGLLVTP